MLKDPELERIPDFVALTGVPALARLVKKNFDALLRYFESNGQFNGFNHIEFTAPQGSSTISIKHGLGFVPRDIVLTRLLAPSGVKLTLHHDLFTDEDIVVSVSGSGDVSLRARMFVGTYRKTQNTTETLDSTATDQEFKAVL